MSGKRLPGKPTPGESVPAGTDSGRTAEKLAAKAGGGARTVNRAITVRESGK